MEKGICKDRASSKRTSILIVIALVIGSLVLGIRHIDTAATAGFSTPNVLVDDGPADTYYPSIAVDDTGRLHAAWLDTRNGVYDIFYAYSVNGGAVWSSNVLVDDSPLPILSSAPKIAVDDSGGPYDGNIYVAYTDARESDDHVYVSTSTDGGSSWSADIKVDNAPSGADCLEVSIAVDDGGTVYVAWNEFIGGTSQIYISRSGDGGNTWSSDVQVSASATSDKGNPSISTYGSGTVYLTWREQDTGYSIVSARSTNSGDTWFLNTVLQTPSMVHKPDIVVDVDENLYITWTKNIPGDSSIYFSSSSTHGSSWTPPVHVDDDTTGSNQDRPSIGVNDHGIYIAWQDHRNGDADIFFSESEDGGATWGDGFLNNNDIRVDDTDINANPSDDSTTQQQPDLAVGEWGCYVIWSDNRGLANHDIYFARDLIDILLITEIRDSPDGSELIEINNYGSGSFDLTGYYLSIDGVPVDLTPLGTVSPNEYRSIGDPVFANLQVPITLGDEGGIITLYDDSSGLIDDVGYGQKGTAPDPLVGESVARFWNGYIYLNDWARDPTPTFGDGSPPWSDEENDVPSVNQAPEVVLNEIFFNPNFNNDKFVELYYLGSGTLDITGYEIVCDSEYSIGATILDPTSRRFYLKYLMATPFFAGMTVGGDNVYLYDSSGRLLDMVGWTSPHTQDLTMSRVPDGFGTQNGYDDPSSVVAGWRFDQPPTQTVLEIGPDQSQFGDLGESISYNLTVANKQPAADYIDIANAAVSAGWSVAFFDAMGQNPLTDTNGNGIPDTGLLGAGSSVNITVGVTVPSTLPIDNEEVTVVYGMSSIDPLGGDKAILTTKVYPFSVPNEAADPTTIYVKSAGTLGYNNMTTITLEVIGAGNVIYGDIFPADVLFVIDDTSSMENEIDAVKTHVNNITDRLVEKVNDIRFGLVSYKDDPELDLDLTHDVQVFRNAIMALVATDGGDYPEGVEDALALGRNASWRIEENLTKIMILIGDAPPHGIMLACGIAQNAFIMDEIITNTIATDMGADMPEAFQWIAENGSGIFRYVPYGNPSDPNEFPNAIINDVLAHIPSISVAGYDPDITDDEPMINEVLPGHIDYIGDTFKDPATGLPKNPDHVFKNPTNTTLQWEVSQILVNETWSVSFNVTSNELGVVPVGEYPDAKITYTRWDGTEVSFPFPEVFINVLDPLIDPPYINGIQVGFGYVNITWDLSPSFGVNRYEVYGGPDRTSIAFTSTSQVYQSPDVAAPTTQWWAEFPFDTIVNPEYYFVVRAVNNTAPVIKSSTSNTAGYHTITFDPGLNTFSLPLKPFTAQTLDWYVANIPSATSISWLDDNDIWNTYPSSPTPLAELGKGYVLEVSAVTNFVFTGQPTAMIMYNDHYSWDFGSTAKVDAILVGNNIELSWPSLALFVKYYIYWSNDRNGFFTGSYNVLNGGVPVTGSTYIHIGAVSMPGENYYMIIPYNIIDEVTGSSTYSIGVVTEEYNGNEMFGLPLKPVWSDKSADWYVDQIPYALGIVYLEHGMWKTHFKNFPEGIYDTIVEFGRGYEVSVYISSKYSYIGR